MNTQPNVFTPAKLGPVTLRNRIIKAATFEASTPNALVTDDLISYHRLPAAGGVGHDDGRLPGGDTRRPHRGQADLVAPRGDPRTAPADRRHPRRRRRDQRADRTCRPSRPRPLERGRGAAPSDLQPTSKFARAATRDDIDDVVAAHATAARFAIEAGFDAVEIHLGHNYFASSFLSPLINRRDDEFGGSLQNRAKVARSVVEAVRRAVEDTGAGRIAVTAKLNMADGVDGGITVEESLQTAKWLQDDGGLDAIELTAGSSLVNPMYRSEAARRARSSSFTADAVGWRQESSANTLTTTHIC